MLHVRRAIAAVEFGDFRVERNGGFLPSHIVHQKEYDVGSSVGMDVRCAHHSQGHEPGAHRFRKCHAGSLFEELDVCNGRSFAGIQNIQPKGAGGDGCIEFLLKPTSDGFSGECSLPCLTAFVFKFEGAYALTECFLDPNALNGPGFTQITGDPCLFQSLSKPDISQTIRRRS